MMKEPWAGYMESFQIFGNLYFVGTKDVSSHIIDSGDGLILIDSSYPQSLYLVTEGMRRLGLNPIDIKYILHSHGHYDHIGGTKALVELTGAKTFIGEPDVPYVNGTLDLTFAKELGHIYHEAFEPDEVLRDGDFITLGNTEIRVVGTPGHTPGTMSFFFNVIDGQESYMAAMFGGAGMNTLARSFLEKYNLPLTLRDEFLNSLEKVKDEKVDIHIGNHAGDNQTVKKFELMQMQKENPFIDRMSWGQFLERCRKRFYSTIAEEGDK